MRHVKILLVYRPPGSSTSLFLEEFSKLLEHITADLRHKRLLIVGDFNIHVENSNDATARQFLDLLDSFDLVQHVGEKTHANGHTLDLVISNAMDHFVNDVKTTDPVIPDHLAVHSVTGHLATKQTRHQRTRRPRNNLATNVLATKRSLLATNHQ